ncbi:MAG: hypothetical protein JRJ49_00840 [Deltaproteobacteria bacterium]|nr:hypothetical protein [Deltaproteobacteria bacterium]
MINIQSGLYKKLLVAMALIIFGYKTVCAEKNIYTYTKQTTDLTNPSNRFEISNTFITPAMLGVDTEEEKENIIKKVSVKKVILRESIVDLKNIVKYEDKEMIFKPGEDGILRCFDRDTSEELWAFIPPNQLSRLSLIIDRQNTYITSPGYNIFKNNARKIILFGEGDKGKKYYALDITSRFSPVFLYEINEEHTAYTKERQGESRGTPDICKIKISGDAEDVFLIQGGYDANNSAGRSLFTVKVSDGTLTGFNFNYNNYSKMNRSIIEASCFDQDGDGIEDVIYVGDYGGNLFAINDKNQDGNWEIKKLFFAPVKDGFEKKIFYAPKSVAASWGGYIFFGTGDMTKPYNREIVNRFYAIKDNQNEDCVNLTEDDLVNLTDKLILSQDKAEILKQIESKKGWYIKLSEKGEKLAGSPILYGGSLYFTTYTPNLQSYGEARLYTLNYKNGTAVEYSTKQESRSVSEIIGEGIPSAPIIKILKNSSELHIEIRDEIIKKQPVEIPNLNVYFWRRIYN